MSKDLRLQIILSAIDKATAPVKQLLGASNNLAKGVKEARNRLKELEAANARMQAFRQTSRDLAVTGNTLQQATARVAQLKQEIAATENPTKAQNRALQEAIRTAGQLKDRNQALAEKQQRLRTELELAGTPTRELARHQAELQGKIKTATAAIAEQEKALKKHGETLRKIAAARAQYDKAMETRNKLAGAGASMIAAGTATTGVVAAPVLAFTEAEDARTQLQVAMMQNGGVVSAQYQRIADLADRLGNRLPGTTADFQAMMTMLIRQGMTTQAILGGLGEATAYLGVQLKIPFTEAAEFAAKLQDATRTTEGEMMGLMDTIQRTFYLGVDSNNLLTGFAKLSPLLDVVKKQGLEFTGMMTPLMVMADQAGMVGESAGNAYRKIFQYALDVKKLGDANDILSGRGIKLDFSDGKGEFGGLDRMFEQLSQLKNVDTQTRLAAIKKLFGDDAETLQAVGLMIDKGAAGYAEVQAKMTAQASIQDRVNKQLGTLKNLWDAASGTFVNALVAFGESIAPELKALTEWIGRAAEGLQAWAKNHPVLAGALMKTVAIVGVLMLALGGLALAVAAVIGPFAILRYGFALLSIGGAGPLSMLLRLGGTILPMVGKAILFIGRALLLNPIGLLITAIAGAAFLIYKYWEPISGFFSGLWNGIATFARTTWSGLITWFTSLPAQMLTIGGQIIDGLWAGMSAKWEGLKAKVGEIANSVAGAVKGALGIHSPSRVFAELGGYTMQGLQLGLQNAAAGPLNAVTRVAGNLAAAGAVALGASLPALAVDNRPPLTPPRAGATGCMGGDTIQIIVQAAPGMDELRLADLVAKKLEDLQRRKAAAGRSRLTDAD